MSKISIELDASVVQEAIHARVAPAVEAVLSRYDLQALVERKLTERRCTSRLLFRLGTPVWHADADVGIDALGQPLIEDLVEKEITACAEAWVRAHLAAERPKLEAAFTRMAEGSTKALVQAYARSLGEAIDTAWCFEMTTQVAPLSPERD